MAGPAPGAAHRRIGGRYAGPRPGRRLDAAAVTAAVTTSARPSRRGLIGTVLLVAIVTAAVLSWQWWDRSQEGEFSSDAKFCELVASETIHRLVPESYGGREDIASCTWAAPREKGKYRAGVHLFASRLIVDLAREDMREMRANGELGWEKDTVEDLPGRGDVAFLRFRPRRPARASPRRSPSAAATWSSRSRTPAATTTDRPPAPGPSTRPATPLPASGPDESLACVKGPQWRTVPTCCPARRAGKCALGQPHRRARAPTSGHQRSIRVQQDSQNGHSSSPKGQVRGHIYCRDKPSLVRRARPMAAGQAGPTSLAARPCLSPRRAPHRRLSHGSCPTRGGPARIRRRAAGSRHRCW